MKAFWAEQITMGSYPNKITGVVALHITGIDVNLMEPGGPVVWLALEAERVTREATPEEPGSPSDPDANPPIVGKDTIPAQPAQTERVALPNVEWRGEKVTSAIVAAIRTIEQAGMQDLIAEGVLPKTARV